MKLFNKLMALGALLTAGFTACEKADVLPYYATGTIPVYSVVGTDLTLTNADATKQVVTFNWTDPNFETDAATEKFIVEVAPAGKSFANSVKYELTNVKTFGLTGSQLNNLLVAWGAKFGESFSLDTRLVASYANNNDRKVSSTVVVKAKAYAVPFSLSTGSGLSVLEPTIDTKNDAIEVFQWNKPTYGAGTRITYTLEYAKAGTSFANAKSMAVGSEMLEKVISGLDANIMARDFGTAYGEVGELDVRIKAVIDGTGQTSYSSVKTIKIKPSEMTLFLWIAGDFQQFDPYKADLPSGNTWGWNPETAPKIASSDGVNYDGYIWVPAGGSGDFKITKAPNWGGGDFGGGSGNTLTNGGSNIKWPATGKYFRVQVNTQEMTWSATEITTWGVIGDGTPGNWGASTPLTFDPATITWSANIPFTAGEFKFRANDSWDINFGGDAAQMTYGGGNFVSPGGTRKVTLNLNNPPYFTYSLQ